MTDTTQYKLIIFDLDKTLCDFDSDTLYPDAAQWLLDHAQQPWCIASNQGGIGLRYWMESGGFGEPEQYPSLQDFERRIANLFPDFSLTDLKYYVLMCARYQSKTSGKWCPVPDDGAGLAMWREDWRKPAPGMLLHAMMLDGVAPHETLMVGDGEEDRAAAEAAGSAFMWAYEFFGREAPQAGEGEGNHE